MDSELIVMRAGGTPPLALARPALAMAALTTLILWFMTMWLGPVSLASMQNMRQVIKAQYLTLLFREGVFNAVVPGLTVFVRDRDPGGELHGLIIHDSRKESEHPVTVLAKRGVIVATDQGQQVLVYDGSRQSLSAGTGALDRLVFDRYSIDLPEGSGPVRQRWQEPDERTFIELLNPDPASKRDQESRWEFTIEAHRRIASPLLAPAFALIALNFLLLGPLDRRGQGWRIAAAAAVTVLTQGLYLAAFSMARHSVFGLLGMYVLALAPLLGGLFLLSGAGENARRRFLLFPGRSLAQ
jgi:lipopolysaccharide export system permease protein